MSDSTWLRSFTAKTLSIRTDFLFRQLWVLTLSNKKKLNLFDRAFLEISAVCDLPVTVSELWLPSAITTLSENLAPNNDIHYFTMEQLLFCIKWFFAWPSWRMETNVSEQLWRVCKTLSKSKGSGIEDLNLRV
jgi:hypothetical protein